MTDLHRSVTRHSITQSEKLSSVKDWIILLSSMCPRWSLEKLCCRLPWHNTRVYVTEERNILSSWRTTCFFVPYRCKMLLIKSNIMTFKIFEYWWLQGFKRYANICKIWIKDEDKFVSLHFLLHFKDTQEETLLHTIKWVTRDSHANKYNVSMHVYNLVQFSRKTLIHSFYSKTRLKCHLCLTCN